MHSSHYLQFQVASFLSFFFCGYVKLNIDSQELARRQGKNHLSTNCVIKHSLTRIRKKLQKIMAIHIT